MRLSDFTTPRFTFIRQSTTNDSLYGSHRALFYKDNITGSLYQVSESAGKFRKSISPTDESQFEGDWQLLTLE